MFDTAHRCLVLRKVSQPIWTPHWVAGITVDYEDIGPFTNIGSGLSGMSGRISHALGLRGQGSLWVLSNAVMGSSDPRCVNEAKQ